MVGRSHFRVDLHGERFGRLIVRNYVSNPKRLSHGIWECVCDCGTVTLVRTASLTLGLTKSCGCWMSELARERGAQQRERRFWDMVDVRGYDQCWPWKGYRRPSKAGPTYGLCRLKRRMMHAHRLAWQLDKKKTIPRGFVVMHTCDNPPCCNPRHLSCVKHSENMADMRKKGRAKSPKGADNPRAKFTKRQANRIREKYHANWPTITIKQLAKQHGVHPYTMGRLVRGESYKTE